MEYCWKFNSDVMCTCNIWNIATNSGINAHRMFDETHKIKTQSERCIQPVEYCNLFCIYTGCLHNIKVWILYSQLSLSKNLRADSVLQLMEFKYHNHLCIYEALELRNAVHFPRYFCIYETLELRNSNKLSAVLRSMEY